MRVPAALIVTASKVLEERGVDVCKVNFDEFESLVSAFTGAFGVYAVTDCKQSTILLRATRQLIQSSGFDAGDRERQQGINIVNAAIKAEVQHLIWSCVPLAACGSTSSNLLIIPFNRTSEHTEYKILYYETKWVIALLR